MLMTLVAATVLAADPCTLVTKADAATVTGTAPTTVLSYGPEADPETKAKVTWCVMSGAPVGLLVYIDDFATPAAAVKVMTPARIVELMANPAVKVEPEAGLGDRAFWAHADDVARIVVIRGATVLSIVIGGDLTKAGEKRAAARAVALTALKRL
jgi:hypothetical protein